MLNAMVVGGRACGEEKRGEELHKSTFLESPQEQCLIQSVLMVNIVNLSLSVCYIDREIAANPALLQASVLSYHVQWCSWCQGRTKKKNSACGLKVKIQLHVKNEWSNCRN